MKVKTYWLTYKSQLIRAAPRHVRGDILGPQHALDDVTRKLPAVRQLKSRGVTRFYDLRRTNRQQLEDVEEDEQYDEGPFQEDPDEPPRHRLRLEIPAMANTEAERIEPDVGEYSPTSPAHSSFAPTTPRAPPSPVPAMPHAEPPPPIDDRGTKTKACLGPDHGVPV